MSKGTVNKVTLIGNLGKDPEVRYMPSGDAIANLSIATMEHWKDKNSGETQERTEWHKVALFGRLAEVAKEYLAKGSKIYVEGKLRTRKWQDSDGNDRYTTEVLASEIQFLSPKDEGGSTKSRPAQESKPKQDSPGHGPKDFDDDIPFAAHMRHAEYLI